MKEKLLKLSYQSNPTRIARDFSFRLKETVKISRANNEERDLENLTLT